MTTEETRINAVVQRPPLTYPLTEEELGLLAEWWWDAYFDNEGRYSVYLSNMYSHAGNRGVAVTRTLNEENRRKVLFSAQGYALFESRDGWRETAIARGVARADWAWGSVFFDLENDGDKDLFVANGFTTHSDPAAPDY